MFRGNLRKCAEFFFSGDRQVPQHYNWLLSAVTLLVSDVFLYQSKGSIEQTTAERLEIVAPFHLKVKWKIEALSLE